MSLSRLPTEDIFLLAADNAFPLNLHLIAEQQLADKHFRNALTSQQPNYKKVGRDSAELYVNSKQETIYVPASLRASLLQWYHLTLQHPGIKRMQATLKENFYWPRVDVAVGKIVKKCDTCQRYKLTAVKKYGKIPLPANNKLTHWEEIHVDLKWPWDVHYNSKDVPGKSTIEKNHALTIIDKATGWPEFIAICNKSSYHIALLFDSNWLCRYPRPAKVVFDNGTEFVGQEFHEVERVHLTMGDLLQTMTFRGVDWYQDMQRALDAIAWAVRTTINPSIKHSPCHLAFNQDMIFRRAVSVNREAINQERQRLVAASNDRENKSRLNRQYAPGDQVLIILDTDERRSQPKMNAPTKGPFIITQVNPNGTVKINRGNVVETINIR
jgi:hypothetical protein